MSFYKGQGIVTKANNSLIYSYWIKWIDPLNHSFICLFNEYLWSVGYVLGPYTPGVCWTHICVIKAVDPFHLGNKTSHT